MCLLCFTGCDTDTNREKKLSNEVLEFENKYVVNKDFKVGDVRRYGVTPNQDFDLKFLQEALDVAEKGVELFFPEGTYKGGFNINSRKNIEIYFDNASFTNVIHITNENGDKSSNINLKGKLITYDRFGVYESDNIKVDTLIIKSNKNIHEDRKESRGCHIYTNTTNLSINYLKIEDLGDEEKNNHAALAVDGFPNYPKNIHIKKAIIESSKRHGAYIMGFNHKIDTLIVNNYGIGNGVNMSAMQGKTHYNEKNFIGIWFNECYNTQINYLEINKAKSENEYLDIFFDMGDKKYPIKINKVKHNNKILTYEYSGEIIN
ncbi:hypothetical protein [Lacinutrix chionoecetis]